MEIRELSNQTGVPSKTIRYYEEIGLLPKPDRKSNGYRVYKDSDIQRLRLVAGSRQLDISLAEIQEILDMRDRKEAPCNHLLDVISEKRDEIQSRIEQLKKMDAELEKLHTLGMSFPKDDIEGKHCVCHLVSEKSEHIK